MCRFSCVSCGASANLHSDAESMPKFAVRCVKVVRVPHNPEVKAKTKAPLTAVAVLGCMMSMLLLALAIYWQDLPALLANLCLSFLSTLIGLGNKWRLELPKRAKKSHHVPPGDVVIRYPKGSFLIVQCDEDVARELYFAPETINYLVSRPPIYRLISLVGTMMLMFGVISLANADNKLQVAFAGCYMALNAAYWVVAAVPAKLHWDTSLFRVENQRFDKHYHAEDDRLVPVQRCKNEIVQHDTFTEALWKVLVVTRSIEWVRRNEAAPETSVWDQWLRDALEKTQGIPEPYTIDKQGMTVWTVPKWDPQGHFGMLQKAENEKNATIRAEVQHRARVSYESQRLVEMEPLQV